MSINQHQRGDAESFFTIAVFVVMMLMFLALPIIAIMKQATYRTETVTIDRTERVSESKSSRYLVWTDKGVYENTDELFQWKFNSSDLYGELKAGKKYDCDVVGWRIQFLSWYPNLISCSEVKS